MADYNAGPREYSGTRLYLGNLPKDSECCAPARGGAPGLLTRP